MNQGGWDRDKNTQNSFCAFQVISSLQYSTYKPFTCSEHSKKHCIPAPTVRSVVLWSFYVYVACLKDSQISSLERGLRELEDQVMMLRSSNMLTCEERQEEVKQMEVYRNHTKFMKNKVVQVQRSIGNELLGFSFLQPTWSFLVWPLTFYFGMIEEVAMGIWSLVCK